MSFINKIEDFFALDTATVPKEDFLPWAQSIQANALQRGVLADLQAFSGDPLHASLIGNTNYFYDAGDTTTADDNGVTCIVTADGKRFKPAALGLQRGTASAPGAYFLGDTNTGLFWGGANEIGFAVNGAEAARFDASKRFLSGHTAGLGFNGIGSIAHWQLHGVDTDTSTLAQYRWQNSSTGVQHYLNHSRGASAGLHVILQADDGIGSLISAYSDGTDFHDAVSLQSFVDGSPGNDSTPGGLNVRTTPSGATATVIRRTYKADGKVLTGYNLPINLGATSAQGVTEQLHGIDAGGAQSAVYRWSNSNGGATFAGFKSRGATAGTRAIVQSGDILLTLAGFGDDGTNAPPAANIRFEVDGTPGAADMPGRIIGSTTADGASNPTERFRVSQAGLPYFPGATTTATAANAVLDNASTPANELLRSTSSLRYKRDVEDLDLDIAAKLLSARPIWYRSKASHDNPEHSWYGYAAEEIAAIDPRLVNWGYAPEDLEHYLDGEGDTAIYRTRVKRGAKLAPDGVAYDRVAVLQITALKAKVAALEAKLAA